MTVPLAIAATEVIVARLGGNPIGFPLTETDRILELDDPEARQVEREGLIIRLSDEETIGMLAPDGPGESRYAVVVRSAGRRIAVPVDELVEVTRLSTMPLPESLPPVELFRSVAILADGSVLRLLDPPALVEDLPPAPKLRVADDSAAWLERGRAWFTEAGLFVRADLPGGYQLVEPLIHGLAGSDAPP
jgi:chemotaxis protein histidine kinase CheA